MLSFAAFFPKKNLSEILALRNFSYLADTYYFKYYHLKCWSPVYPWSEVLQKDTSQSSLTVTAMRLHAVSEYINPNLHSLGVIIYISKHWVMKGVMKNFF